jgi:hypothetical protein
MSMNWRDERYVRLYTRDTPSWLCLSFPAQGLFMALLRKVDRAGVLEFGKVGRRGVYLAIGHVHQAAMLDPALDELLTDGCVEINGDLLVIPNFMEAQEAEASDKARAKKHREIRKAKARGVTDSEDTDKPVTPESQGVTPDRDDGVTHTTGPVTPASRTVTTVTKRDTTVTPNHAVPSKLAAEEQQPRRLEVVDEGGGEPTPYPWPKAASFRQALTHRMARTVLYPVGGQEPKIMGSLEASLAVVPEAEAVELCRERVVAASAANDRRVPGTLSYFAQVLADEATKRQIRFASVPRTRVCIGADDNGQPLYAEGK